MTIENSQIRTQFQNLEPDKTRGSCGRKRRRLAASWRNNWASRRAGDASASRSSRELEVQIAKYAAIGGGGGGANDTPTRVDMTLCELNPLFPSLYNSKCGC